MQRVMEPSSIKRVLNEPCCAKQCMTRISTKLVQNERRMLWSMTTRARFQWIIQVIGQHDSQSPSVYMVQQQGQRVGLCMKAWRALYHINKQCFYQCRAKVSCGVTNKVNRKARDMTRASMACLQWMRNYFTMTGDRLPHKGQFQVTLPFRTRWNDVYKCYLDDIELGKDYVSLSHFHQLRRTYFPHVKVKQVRN